MVAFDREGSAQQMQITRTITTTVGMKRLADGEVVYSIRAAGKTVKVMLAEMRTGVDTRMVRDSGAV